MVPVLGAFEAVGIGLNFENAQLVYKNYVYMHGLGMLWIDFAIFSMLGIYLDNIMPRESGQQRHWAYPMYFFKASYWDCFDLCKKNNRAGYDQLKTLEPKKVVDAENILEAFETKYIKKENFEEPDIALV